MNTTLQKSGLYYLKKSLEQSLLGFLGVFLIAWVILFIIMFTIKPSSYFEFATILCFFSSFFAIFFHAVLFYNITFFENIKFGLSRTTSLIVTTIRYLSVFIFLSFMLPLLYKLEVFMGNIAFSSFATIEKPTFTFFLNPLSLLKLSFVAFILLFCMSAVIAKFGKKSFAIVYALCLITYFAFINSLHDIAQELSKFADNPLIIFACLTVGVVACFISAKVYIKADLPN